VTFTEEKAFIKNLYLIKLLWTTETYDSIPWKRMKRVWIWHAFARSCVKRRRYAQAW